jgi:hypothetical protein
VIGYNTACLFLITLVPTHPRFTDLKKHSWLIQESHKLQRVFFKLVNYFLEGKSTGSPSGHIKAWPHNSLSTQGLNSLLFSDFSLALLGTCFSHGVMSNSMFCCTGSHLTNTPKTNSPSNLGYFQMWLLWFVATTRERPHEPITGNHHVRIFLNNCNQKNLPPIDSH